MVTGSGAAWTVDVVGHRWRGRTLSFLMGAVVGRLIIYLAHAPPRGALTSPDDHRAGLPG
jgi:hypothetical protein